MDGSDTASRLRALPAGGGCSLCKSGSTQRQRADRCLCRWLQRLEIRAGSHFCKFELNGYHCVAIPTSVRSGARSVFSAGRNCEGRGRRGWYRTVFGSDSQWSAKYKRKLQSFHFYMLPPNASAISWRKMAFRICLTEHSSRHAQDEK